MQLALTNYSNYPTIIELTITSQTIKILEKLMELSNHSTAQEGLRTYTTPLSGTTSTDWSKAYSKEREQQISRSLG